MRLRINSIVLEGTKRNVAFEPGLNIITGPIASGKTTLFRYIRSIFGASLESLPIEARNSVSAISTEVLIGSTSYSIIRPAVTTPSAMVDIASEKETLRLPVTRANREIKISYIQWLLDRLELPRLEVPSAPSKPDSELTPVSLNDYMLYCTITQNDIGFAICGHTDPFKNIKRKYVFEIIYGIYSIEMAKIQDELRDVQSQLRELRNQNKLFTQFLKDTALENRANIERNLKAAKKELTEIENKISKKHAEARISPATETLQLKVLKIESEIQHLQSDIDAELQAQQDLERLASQLESQFGKITRSIVAHTHLSDIEFVVCPRCGANISQDRTSNNNCYLCLQQFIPEKTPQISRENLINEQARIEAQIAETRDLLQVRQNRLNTIKRQLTSKQEQENRIKNELDFQTSTFISSEAGRITALAAKRADLKARIIQLSEYLQVYNKLDQTQKLTEELLERKETLEQRLDSAMGKEFEVQLYIKYLNDKLNHILQKFRAPEFGEEKLSTIDFRTYLPLYRGRKFSDISSPGLGTLVSVAYSLAHQITSIDLQLKLPNILFIDGLSEHLGEEGLDPERLESMYKYLIEISEEKAENLQIIVVDNKFPSYARKYIRLELSDTERLIPRI
ncbi:MAG: hypothetical protein ACFFD2_20000 [Promethearchaeota archaeon]